MAEQTTVSFNPEQKKLWEELFNRGATSQSFPEFVRDGYYDKVDAVKASKLNLSHAEIERIAMDCIMRVTKASQ